jgi:alpha(1,3/1,4) fucosyltransferase
MHAENPFCARREIEMTSSSSVRSALFIASGIDKNSIFRLDHPSNRDNCNYPFYLLRQKLLEQGYDLKTPDLCGSNDVAFALYLNHTGQLVYEQKSYVILLETPHIRRKNGDLQAVSTAHGVFTWNDDYVRKMDFIKINFPNELQIPVVDGWQSRDHFCCVIAGNKSVAMDDGRGLYVERVRAIRWFEKNAPEDFDLYGTGWDDPPSRRGVLGKVTRHIWRVFSRMTGNKPFPSYRGKVDKKLETLRRTRFSICYENVRDMPGYVTEKIFDCFVAGCIPIYWGPNNISDYIPADCFIDRRIFVDTAAVYAHIKKIDEATYRGYQQRIAEFLTDERAQSFSSEAFAQTIVDTISRDIFSQT